MMRTGYTSNWMRNHLKCLSDLSAGFVMSKSQDQQESWLLCVGLYFGSSGSSVRSREKAENLYEPPVSAQA